MFASVGRRLAFLNAAVVAATLVAVVVVSVLLLLRGLAREADRSLAERVAVAAADWQDDLAAGRAPVPAPAATSGDSEEAEDEGHEQEDDEDDEAEEAEHEALELLENGDTFLFAFDAGGALVGQAPATASRGLPVAAGVERARGGHSDERTVDLGGGVEARVRTVPVYAEGRLVGAVQGVRGLGQRQEQVRLVLEVGAGVGLLGLLVAAVAGLFLARRAMRPIAAAFERQRAFVADASHELRTPLALLRANTELLQRLPDPSPAELRSETEAMLDEIDGMTGLVDDLLTLARLDAGVAPGREAVDLGALVAEAVAPLVPRAEAAGLSLRVEAEPLPVVADPHALTRLTRILTVNAIAYTPSGGTITVGVARRGRRAVLTVRDTGIGIAPEDQARVFERFYRADPARGHGAGGAGLGLPIARGIAQAHGGQIRLTSAPGQGTTVEVALPLAGVSEGLTRAGPAAT